MIVTFVFCITDIETMIIDSTAVFPYIGVFYAATSSKAGATAMTALLAAMNFAACLSTLAAASRQAWSFGRDEGLPFSHWFRKASHLVSCSRLDPANHAYRSPHSVYRSPSMLAYSRSRSPSSSRFSISAAPRHSTALSACLAAPAVSHTRSVSDACFGSVFMAESCQSADGRLAS